MSTRSKTTWPTSFITYLSLAGVLSLGLWLRLEFIQTVQLYPDEFATLLAIDMIRQKGLPILPSGLFYEHGLLFSYLGTVASWLGEPRWWVRYASLCCGMMTLGLTFYLGRRYVSPMVGLMATTALAIAPTAIEWSGRARMYALMQLLVLLTLWLAYEGLMRHKSAWRWAALFSYFGATLSHFVTLTLAPPFAVIGLINGLLTQPRQQTASQPLDIRRGPTFSWMAQTVTFMLLILTALLIKRAGQPKGIEALDSGNATAGLVEVLSIYSDVSFNLVGGWLAISPFYLMMPAVLFGPFVVVGLGRIAYCVLRGQRERLNGLGVTQKLKESSVEPVETDFDKLSLRKSCGFNLFLMGVLSLTTLEMMLLVSPDRRDDKYLFMLLPILFLVGGYGLERCVYGVMRGWPNFMTPWKSSVTTTIICLAMIGLTWGDVRALLEDTGDDYDNAFAYVQANWQEGDAILTGTPAAAYFYMGHNDFYSVQRRGGYDYRLLTVDGQAVDRWLGSPAIRTKAALHETLAHQRVWLVLERWGLQREYYELPFQQQLLAQTEYQAEAQGVFILRSKPQPKPQVDEPAHATEAIFGEQVQLIGYTIERLTTESLRLTLYWQAIAPMPHDYTVFVHLRTADGRLLTQADHRPLGPVYPTSLWPIGETIRETSDLIIQPNWLADELDLSVGLYRLETGERLPLQDDSSGENGVRLRLAIED